MDAKSFLRRITLIAVASTLPAFANVTSAHGGGHSGGSSGGSSSNGSSGGHSSSASNSGHSSSGSNSGHSASVSKVGHPAGDPSGPVAMTGGRSVLATSVRPGTVRSNEVHQFSVRPRTIQSNEVHRFSTGYVPNEQYREWWRKHHPSRYGLSP
jgi:hypothetical protein